MPHLSLTSYNLFQCNKCWIWNDFWSGELANPCWGVWSEQMNLSNNFKNRLQFAPLADKNELLTLWAIFLLIQLEKSLKESSLSRNCDQTSWWVLVAANFVCLRDKGERSDGAQTVRDVSHAYVICRKNTRFLIWLIILSRALIFYQFGCCFTVCTSLCHPIGTKNKKDRQKSIFPTN